MDQEALRAQEAIAAATSSGSPYAPREGGSDPPRLGLPLSFRRPPTEPVLGGPERGPHRTRADGFTVTPVPEARRRGRRSALGAPSSRMPPSGPTALPSLEETFTTGPPRSASRGARVDGSGRRHHVPLPSSGATLVVDVVDSAMRATPALLTRMSVESRSREAPRTALRSAGSRIATVAGSVPTAATSRTRPQVAAARVSSTLTPAAPARLPSPSRSPCRPGPRAF